MASFTRLAAVLAACLPVSGFVGSPFDGGASRLQQGSTREPSLSPLRAYVNSNEGGAAQLREALVTSEAFEDLVQRLEKKTQHIAPSKGEEDATSDGSTGVVVKKAPASSATAALKQPTGSSAVAPLGDVSGGAAHSEGTDDAWKENSEKLDALRKTVHESPKAREMRKKIGSDGHGGVSGSSHSSPCTTTTSSTGASSSSSSDAAAGGATADAMTSDAWAVASQQQGPEASSSITAAAAATAAPDAPTEATDEEEGEQGGRGARRFRWVGRLASRVSNVGKRVRARTARKRASDSATEEGQGL